MSVRINICLAFMLLCSWTTQADRISPSRDYPGYWDYCGETVLLVGGWDHGHNPFLDHSTIDGGGYEDTSTEKEILAALDLLQDCGGNLLRCVLDPGVAAGRQGFPFCRVVDGKYDLDHMEGSFWERLEFFLDAAEKRQIIVGLEIWDRFDWYDGGHEGWPASPFNPANNVNYSKETSGLAYSYPGKGDKSENPFGQTVPGQAYYDSAAAETKAQLDLIRSYQEAFMRKLLSITLRHGNVLYSANNEVRHQEPEWGLYWISFIRREAERAGVQVNCTDMFWDILNIPESPGFDHLVAHPELYDYFDVSQTSAHIGHQDLNPQEAGEIHWRKVTYAVEKGRSVNRLLHMDKIYGSQHRVNRGMGSEQNAIEEFWRSLIAGVAGVRFHRPESGIGLSPLAQASIRSARLVEKQVRFWEVESRMDLLTGRQTNEAYLAADPGNQYILFMPDGGDVGIDVSQTNADGYAVRWIDLRKGVVAVESDVIGNDIVRLAAPDKGPWVAVIVRE